MPKGHALSEAMKEGIWELRAQGLSEREIGRQLGLGRNTVSLYLRALGGIRPRPCRRAERCLSADERVSERLGHATVAFTLDTYSHVLPGLQEDAAAKVAALIASS